MNNDGEARFAVTPSFVLTHSSDSIFEGYILASGIISQIVQTLPVILN